MPTEEERDLLARQRDAMLGLAQECERVRLLIDPQQVYEVFITDPADRDRQASGTSGLPVGAAFDALRERVFVLERQRQAALDYIAKIECCNAEQIRDLLKEQQ
jgi:hypothetical protein